ncbi:magnesium transporter [Mycolicibacterium pyrenivorans]|uniref:magnesium transporter n=1 Tax=Mycolicibacterium pyrenivorans TaxID=187102 RepID=UPI0021F31251|nr:magnesium transporter [Mycolicibacterium pyrenivorans]MCV7151337.1 magnesium transporter [Mycolicibacterium pyrenivorans]
MASDLILDAVGRPGSAMSHASTRIPTAAADDSVAATLDRMRGERFDSAATVAVLDDDRLLGVATIERMFAAPAGATLNDVMDSAPPVVAPDTDQEHAAWQAVQRGEPGLAVVGGDGRFRGLIAPQQLLAVLLVEHDEDMARLGGFLHSVQEARTTTVESVTRRLWHRMPWLLVGLVGAMIAAGLMSTFEGRLGATLAVAYFVPGIVYLADAVGTQTETVAIRGLSVGIGIRRILGPEVLTGLLVGVLLGGGMFPMVGLMVGDWMLACAVAVALLAASSIATVVALVLPWLINRMGKDPAFGSGPLATVIQDLLTIAIYLGAVTVLLA